MTWKEINHPQILPGYLISPYGDIKAKGMKDSESTKASYHSTNGYDYVLLYNKSDKLQLFPIDDIVAYAYLPIPESLKNKPIKVLHVDGNTRNNELGNLEWVEDVEEWRDVVDPDIVENMYEVSSWGNVRNKETKIIIYSKSRGYKIANMRSVNGTSNSIQRSINRIVASAFISGNSSSRCIVNHINGEKMNNHIKNLEWVTYRENVKHGYLTGLTTISRGELSASSKINEEIAKEIWSYLTDEIVIDDDRSYGSPKKVANKLQSKYPDITEAIVSRIKKKRFWGNIEFDKSFKFEKEKLTESIVEKIWMLLADDPDALNGREPTKGYSHIVRKYLKDEGVDVPLYKIHAIKNGVSWKSVVSKLPQQNFEDCRKVLNEKEAKKIWDTLNDDPVALDGRTKTNGDTHTVVIYLKDEIPRITSGIVYSIKTGRSWTNLTGIKHNRS